MIEDSRGVAIADLDGDGRLDMVVANNADPPAILLNRSASQGHWLRVSLEDGSGANRDAIGARVEVGVRIEGELRRLSRWVEAGSGYCSQSDRRLHFGLGTAAQIESLRVEWPGGELLELPAASLDGLIDRDVRLRRGAGLVGG